MTSKPEPVGDLVHLHTHSHNSGFDGLGSAELFMQRAREMGQSALAFTEHGTLRGLYESHVAAKSVGGIKVIPGEEFYVTDDATLRGLTPADKERILAQHETVAAGKAAIAAVEAARRSRDHVTVWALNDVGLRNLYRLSSWSWSEGYYYKPRIDIARLAQYNEGLAVSTGCPGGIVAGPLHQGRSSLALDRVDELADIFGDRLYVELMPHLVGEHERVSQQLVQISKTYGAKLIATQDAHYPSALDADAQDVLLCIHTRARLCDEDRFCFDSKNYWLRSRSEMERAFRTGMPSLSASIIKGALDETMAFADRCTANLDLTSPGKYLVAPALPPGVDDYDGWLLQLVRDGARDRFGMDLNDLGGDYRDRIKHELKTVFSLDFASYFVAVWELRQWARQQGILCGPGRGSAAGSMLCYLLRITDLDPIHYGLSFERFLAPGRVDLPDVDADFESARRQEVIDHLREQYGEDHVAHIATHNLLGGKRSMRDLGRIFEIPEHMIMAVLPLIPSDEEEGLAQALESTTAGEEVAKAFPGIVDIARKLEGNLRDVGLHAAGIVMSSVPLRDIVPLETRPDGRGGRNHMVAYDWQGAEAVGLVKLDVLGLTTLTTVTLALQLSGAKLEDIDLEDRKALDLFTRNLFAGVFQYDTPSARRVCKDFEFKSLADVAVLTALNRPGPISSGLVEEFLKRVKTGEVPAVHPVYDRVMQETFGVPVYQEQVVALARDLAGYSPEEADKFRKAVSKKTGLEKYEEPFIKGFMSSGMSRAEAEGLWNKICGFAQYGFNKAHSFSYAALAMWTMWLKAHQPAAFYAASMSTIGSDEGRLQLAAEARTMGVPVRPPTVNVAGDGFVVKDLGAGRFEIVGGLSDIVGVGDGTALAIAKGAPYRDLKDFYSRTAGAGVRGITAKTFAALARATALRDLAPEGSARPLADSAKDVWTTLAALHKAASAGAPKRAGRKALTEEEGTALWAQTLQELDEQLQALLRPAGPDYSGDEWIRIISEVWPMYVDLKGRGLFDTELELLRADCGRKHGITLPGEPMEVGSFHALFARVASAKVYHDDNGASSRLVLVGTRGGEVVARMDGDVMEQATADGLKVSDGDLVLVAAFVQKEGRASCEAIWRVQDGKLLGNQPILRELMHPTVTRPRNPAFALQSAEDGETFQVSGTILRARRHRDRSGKTMISLGIMGSAGFIRCFGFASTLRRLDGSAVARLRPGVRVSLRVRKLSADAACIADNSVIRFLDGE